MRPRNTETETQSFPTSRTNFATGFAQGAATGAQLIYSGETSHNFCPGQEQGPRKRGGRSVVVGGRQRPAYTPQPARRARPHYDTALLHTTQACYIYQFPD